MEFYEQLNDAFDIFNKKLFNSSLPLCVITLNRKTKVKGYFSAKRFISMDNGKSYKHEISINPDYFGVVSTKDLLSTLVHEMCHLVVENRGHKCTNGYHNIEWANEMLRVGLIPTSTGKEGGKKTGFKMTHIIKKDGEFSKVCDEILNKGFDLRFADRFTYGKEEINEKETVEKIKSGIRYKYTCGCTNIWGKKGLLIKCNKCNKDFILIK